MTTLFNSTLHSQAATEAAFANFGFTFVGGTDGHGFTVGVQEDFASIQQRAAAVVQQAVDLGADALLIGGMSSIAIALCDAAREAGLGVFETATERVRDENDRFIFRLSGVRRIA